MPHSDPKPSVCHSPRPSAPCASHSHAAPHTPALQRQPRSPALCRVPTPPCHGPVCPGARCVCGRADGGGRQRRARAAAAAVPGGAGRQRARTSAGRAAAAPLKAGGGRGCARSLRRSEEEEEEAAAAPPATMSGTRASNDRTSHPGGGLKRARSEPGGNKVTVVLGAQWGDEGKGKVVDLLATESDVVCRCQVGPEPALTPFFLGSPSPLVPCFFIFFPHIRPSRPAFPSLPAFCPPSAPLLFPPRPFPPSPRPLCSPPFYPSPLPGCAWKCHGGGGGRKSPEL